MSPNTLRWVSALLASVAVAVLIASAGHSTGRARRIMAAGVLPLAVFVFGDWYAAAASLSLNVAQYGFIPALAIFDCALLYGIRSGK